MNESEFIKLGNRKYLGELNILKLKMGEKDI